MTTRITTWIAVGLFRLGLIALMGAAAAFPARADFIGDPDNSWIRYEFTGGGLASSPVTDYSSPIVNAALEGSFYSVIDYSPGWHSWQVNARPQDGVLRALASVSSGLYCPSDCAINPEESVLTLSLRDRIFIDQEIMSPITVTVRLGVDGVLTGPGDSNTQVVSTLQAYVDPGLDLSFDEFNSGGLGAYEFVLFDDAALYPGQQWFDIDAFLQLNVYSTYEALGVFTTADFLNTALLDIDLPDGFTFRSEAGFTGSIVQVPEPGTLALFGSGLASLCWTMRRRKTE